MSCMVGCWSVGQFSVRTASFLECVHAKYVSPDCVKRLGRELLSAMKASPNIKD